MEIIICITVFFCGGYFLGVYREKKRGVFLVRESYSLGYRTRSREEICKKIERRKNNHEN